MSLIDNEIKLSPTLFPEEYSDWYDYQFDAVDVDSDHLQIFNDEMMNLSKLNKVQLENRQMQLILKRQIYIGVVSSMETYLSDKFISTVSNDELYLKKFVETHPEFLKRKFELKDVFHTYDNIRDTAKVIMLDIIYHDLVKVRNMYSDTFSVDFPAIKDVLKCVVTRHDLVHRNGKTKNQKHIMLDDEVVKKAIETVERFINELALNMDFKLYRPGPGDLPF